MNNANENQQTFKAFAPKKLKAHAPHVYRNFESSSTKTLVDLETWLDSELRKIEDDYSDFVTVNSVRRDLKR